MRTVLAMALAALAAGCGAQLGAGEQGNGGTDANGGRDSSGGRMDAAIDAAPACANGRVVYLNFEGQTITKAATTDSTQNTANWLTNTSAAVPPYHQGSGTRATDIQSIVD